MNSVIAPASDAVLTDEMLARFASRSAKYDRENAFFSDDFEGATPDKRWLKVQIPHAKATGYVSSAIVTTGFRLPK